MAKSRISEDEKVATLSLIRDNKDLLFGAFSNTITYEIKENKWKSIYDELKSIGFLAHIKDYKHLRDVMWQNWKRRTIVSINTIMQIHPITN